MSDDQPLLSDEELLAYLMEVPDQPIGADWESIDPVIAGEPCPECGATGACAWDNEGRPLIHAIGSDDA